MMKTVIALVLTFILFVTFGSANAQMAKEGKGSSTNTYSGTFKAVPLDEDRFVAVYENTGVLTSDSGEGPFHSMSSRGVGIIYFEKGVGKTLGYIVLTDPEDDKVLIEIKENATRPAPSPNSGTGKYIGGTGKFAGIEGTLQYQRWYVGPTVEGTYQAIAKGKGSWKLP